MPNQKSSSKMAASKSVLPSDSTDQLTVRIKKLVSMWADEEQMNGNKVFYWNIIDNAAIINCASQVPTSLSELSALGILKENVEKEYGERLVRNIKAFVEQNNLQRYIDKRNEKKRKKISSSIKSVLPREYIDQLKDRIKTLVMMFVDEEQMNGNKIFYWDIMSNTDMETFASQVPTSLSELSALGTLKEDSEKKYGERLIRVIQSFVEQNNLQSYIDERNKKRKTLVLPRDYTDQLMVRIKKLVSMWADEEQMNGNKVFYWNIMSISAMTACVSQVPTSLSELSALGILGETVQKVYGERLVCNIKSFVEQNNLQRYIDKSDKN